MTRDHASHDSHGFVRALHDIVATRAVDVNVDKAGNRGEMSGIHLFGAGGDTHALTRADCFDHTIANKDARVRNFTCRC